MLTFEIKGLDKLEAELNKIGSSVADNMEDAVMGAGMLIANQASENAPYKSGTLRSATAAPPRITRASKYRVEGRVGPQGVPYARIHEFGGVTGRGHKTRIQGKFYLTKAVEALSDECEQEMVDTIT